MKKLVVILMLVLASGIKLLAEEGMWIPVLLDKLNFKQMQDLGLKLNAEDIYSVNHSSIKDAIVQFGGGCTAEIVSPVGLMLTNHHCGLGAIQRLSSAEHDYLTNGFWAYLRQEELPCSGLTVTLLVRMEEVTEKVLMGVDEKLSQLARSEIIRQNIDLIEKDAVKGTRYEAKVRPFYYGNQYYLFVNEVFRDIRLAGAPPSAIGQFGGDTDNWMWPRHGGDFSVFRIYADKDNNAAPFSRENIPYRPKYYLPVSIHGYKKDDFTFIFGYPGSTREYLTSYGVDLIANRENPVKIYLRQKRLGIMNEAMKEDRLVRIQYTSKHQGIANGWKKMIGETKGIKRMDAVEIKYLFESSFKKWADSVGSQQLVVGSRQDFGGLLPAFKIKYEELLPLDMASVYLTEAGMGIEIVRFALNFRELVKISKDKQAKAEDITKISTNLLKSSKTFFKDYRPEIDEKVSVEMLRAMKENMRSYLPGIFKLIEKKSGDDFSLFSRHLFQSSLFPDSARVRTFLEQFRKSDYKKIEKDPVFQLAMSIALENEQKITPRITLLSAGIDSLQRIYMAAQMQMLPSKRFYPDANSTMRVSYGKVSDYYPSDAVHYSCFTTTDGILQKEDSVIYDYKIDPKLKKLFLEKDFDRYIDKDGSMHIAFTGSNHTTGGNSGSPVLNGEGHLIGLNFDRNWEGTMSDLMYDPEQCRNITLDIRYCLFIIDKFAGAQNLIKEMQVVE